MIHVIDGFYILVDAYQYIAQEDTGVKLSSKGKDYTKWNVLGYFTSLDKALDRIVLELCNRKTKKKTYELVDYIKVYKAESSKIRKMIKQTMKEVEDNK